MISSYSARTYFTVFLSIVALGVTSPVQADPKPEFSVFGWAKKKVYNTGTRRAAIRSYPSAPLVRTMAAPQATRAKHSGTQPAGPGASGPSPGKD